MSNYTPSLTNWFKYWRSTTITTVLSNKLNYTRPTCAVHLEFSEFYCESISAKLCLIFHAPNLWLLHWKISPFIISQIDNAAPHYLLLCASHLLHCQFLLASRQLGNTGFVGASCRLFFFEFSLSPPDFRYPCVPFPTVVGVRLSLNTRLDGNLARTTTWGDQMSFAETPSHSYLKTKSLEPLE